MITPGLNSPTVTTAVATGARSFYVRYGKRTIDLIVALGLLCLLLIPILVLALLIVIDTPGNPFFLQRRIGKNGRAFTMWKLRTMVTATTGSLVLFEDEGGRLCHKVKSDPRITRVGRLLRKTSLDELPQLVNVLLGQMSLVGPRPELPEIVADYEPWQHQRHLVVPGITGWWQVSGRSGLLMHENTELDIYYVERVSLELDWRIIRKTIVSVVKGTGAF